MENLLKKKWKWIVLIMGLFLAVVAGLVIVGNYESEKECAQRLQKVQSGYLGVYNMVTVQDILENHWKDGMWDSFDTDDKHIVEYALDDNNKVQFSVQDDKNIFEVAYIVEEGVVSKEAIEIKHGFDTMYKEYGHAYPERGILVNFGTANDTLSGKIDAVEKRKVLTLSDKGWDISDYLEDTIDELEKKINLEIFTEDDGASYTNESETMLLLTDETEKISMLQMSVGDDKTPSLFGLTIGGSNSGLEELEQEEFMRVSETPDLDEKGTVTVELWRQDTSDALCCTYSSESGEIVKLIYEKEAVDEEMQKELVLKATVDVDDCVQKAKDFKVGEAKASSEFQKLFKKKGSWNGTMQQDGSVVVTYDALESKNNANYSLQVNFLVGLDGNVQYSGGEGIYQKLEKDYEKNLETRKQLEAFLEYVQNCINPKLPSPGSYDWYNDSYFVSRCLVSLESGTDNVYYVYPADCEGFYVTFYDSNKCAVEQADGAWNGTWEYDGANITLYMNSQTVYLYQK